MNLTKKARKEGYNAVIGTSGVGQYYIRVIQVSFGLNITAEEAETKRGGAFYPRRTDTSSFVLKIAFPTYKGRDKFARWMENYGQRIASSRNRLGPMRVIIPARRFDRTAVPTTGVVFGDSYDAVSHPLTIKFLGARTALELSSTYISKFRLTKRTQKNYPEVRYFYPAGDILGGKESGVDTLFQPPPEPEWPGTDVDREPRSGV